MFDHHVQFLMIGKQCNSSRNNKEDQLYHHFPEIEQNENTISNQLENIDWEAEPHLEHNNVNLSLELVTLKFNILKNF